MGPTGRRLRFHRGHRIRPGGVAITMSAPEGTAFGPGSGAIVVKGPSRGNLVTNNRTRGRATAGLSVILLNGGIPADTAFVGNDLDDFHFALADVFVGAGASDTIVIGRQAAVEDHGNGTVVVPGP